MDYNLRKKLIYYHLNKSTFYQYDNILKNLCEHFNIKNVTVVWISANIEKIIEYSENRNYKYSSKQLLYSACNAVLSTSDSYEAWLAKKKFSKMIRIQKSIGIAERYHLPKDVPEFHIETIYHKLLLNQDNYSWRGFQNLILIAMMNELQMYSLFYADMKFITKDKYTKLIMKKDKYFIIIQSKYTKYFGISGKMIKISKDLNKLINIWRNRFNETNNVIVSRNGRCIARPNLSKLIKQLTNFNIRELRRSYIKWKS